MGALDVTCLSRNLYMSNEVTEPDWFKIGKGVWLGFIVSPWLFNFYAEYVMWNAGLNESQAGIKIARRNINNLRYAGYITLMAESEEEIKN